jgi:hypothetical protein
VRAPGLQHSDIDDTPRDDSSGDDNLATIGCDPESLPSEDELIDRDIFEEIIFHHKNPY